MAQGNSCSSVNSFQNPDLPRCGCDRPMKLWVANTVQNRNRKFWKCRNAGTVNSCELFLWDDEIRDHINVHRMKLPDCKSCDILAVKLETAANKIEKLKKKNAIQTSVNMRLKKTILILCFVLIGIVYFGGNLM
ncbi:uncharacterized protein LOC131658125 [Vicia villosa]|uniref:uncharacterized protein LOC131658125 n=1 Tax=Vicia villosa TaxID=3911 RepID=UPI00273CCCF2|nr:uncharacterized protein LOC131658125 [Vicia villosa]